MTRAASAAPSKPQGMGGLRWILAAIVLLGIAVLMTRKESGPPVGTPAAEFALPTVGEAGQVRLADLKGTPVVVEVFASWCSACRVAAPTLAKAATAPRAREVRFLGVSMDKDADTAARTKRAWDIPYSVVLDDGSFARNYRVTMLPTFVLIDAEGRIRRVETGAPREATLEGWLTELGAQRL